MFLWLAEFLQNILHGFGVLQYITLRMVLSALTSLLVCLLLGPIVIRKLSIAQIGQVIRDDGPKTHLNKGGTPTMGGVLILLSITLSVLLWSNLKNLYIWVYLLVLLGFGLIGWIDDYKKLILKNSKGLSAKSKYLWQSILAIGVSLILFYKANSGVEISLLVPFFKNIVIPLGGFFVILSYFVIVGSSNAVNLTDGLDGLAIMPVVLVSGALGVFAYVTGHIKFAEYLVIPYIPGTEELAICCAAMVGSGLGFLWFNAYPAMIMMGDVGALALGAALGAIAVMLRQELVLFIIGGLFVIETISVVLQVGSYKLRKKRIFKMAPIHHHYELAGWPEPRVIIRFWILTVIFVLIGLATLKIR